jgi:hypothetical protein
VTLNKRQFHEMTRDEFESQPGTFFHGHPTGNFNWEHPQGHSGFHVGTKQAATDAVVSRAGFSGKPVTYSNGMESGPTFPGSWEPVNDPERPYVKSRKIAHPEHVRAGRIASPMVNHPGYLGSYGKGTPGDMHDSGDVLANARATAIRSRGQQMRQGIYYMNASEDAGSVSAVLPSRQQFKTHEDHIIEARARGQHVPAHVLKEYPHLGQQRLF